MNHVSCCKSVQRMWLSQDTNSTLLHLCNLGQWAKIWEGASFAPGPHLPLSPLHNRCLVGSYSLKNVYTCRYFVLGIWWMFKYNEMGWNIVSIETGSNIHSLRPCFSNINYYTIQWKLNIIWSETKYLITYSPPPPPRPNDINCFVLYCL